MKNGGVRNGERVEGWDPPFLHSFKDNYPIQFVPHSFHTLHSFHSPLSLIGGV